MRLEFLSRHRGAGVLWIVDRQLGRLDRQPSFRWFFQTTSFAMSCREMKKIVSWRRQPNQFQHIINEMKGKEKTTKLRGCKEAFVVTGIVLLQFVLWSSLNDIEHAVFDIETFTHTHNNPSRFYKHSRCLNRNERVRSGFGSFKRASFAASFDIFPLKLL
jgi:hypothetical protein